MEFIKRSNRAISNLVTMILAISCLLFSPLISHSATLINTSNFMDLESSIKELRARVEKASHSIVIIVVYDITGSESARISGFFIDKKGRILTNANALKNAYSAEVFSESNHYNDVTILSRDEDIDLALIQVNAIDESPLELDFNYKIKRGGRVTIIGKSANLGKTVSEGLISSIININEKLELMQIHTTLAISSFPPSNNGLLLNIAEKVIGLTTATISKKQNFDIITTFYDEQRINAISIRSIKHFLLKPLKVEHLHPPKSRVWYPWFINWIKTAAITGFVTLYELGFLKISAIIFAIIILIAILMPIIQWFYSKFKKI